MLTLATSTRAARYNMREWGVRRELFGAPVWTRFELWQQSRLSSPKVQGRVRRSNWDRWPRNLIQCDTINGVPPMSSDQPVHSEPLLLRLQFSRAIHRILRAPGTG